LVDFWAEWSGPCKQIAPALEQISDELAGVMTVAKVNIEDSPMTPGKYGVRGIPTMMLFRNGQMASMKVGALPKQKILEWLHEAGVQPA
jgi:thioredoxin 1